MLLSMGGHRISTGGEAAADALEGEYPAIYRHFAALDRGGQEATSMPIRSGWWPMPSSSRSGTSVAPFEE